MCVVFIAAALPPGAARWLLLDFLLLVLLHMLLLLPRCLLQRALLLRACLLISRLLPVTLILRPNRIILKLHLRASTREVLLMCSSERHQEHEQELLKQGTHLAIVPRLAGAQDVEAGVAARLAALRARAVPLPADLADEVAACALHLGGAKPAQHL